MPRGCRLIIHAVAEQGVGAILLLAPRLLHVHFPLCTELHIPGTTCQLWGDALVLRLSENQHLQQDCAALLTLDSRSKHCA